MSCSNDGPSSRAEKIEYIRALGESGDNANAPIVAKYLSDEDSEVVMAACFYIGELQGRQYINKLVSLLSSDEKQIVNMAGAGLTNMVDGRDVNLLPELYKILDHEFLLARLSAIEAIGNIGSKSSTDHLMSMFKESTSGQKARIISALGKIGSKESLSMLEAYLDEVKSMDHSVPNKGGTRGVDLHPDALQVITEEAILKIKSNDA